MVADIGFGSKPIPSRAIQKFVHLPDYHHEPEEFIARLSELIVAEKVDTLIPTTDAGLSAMIYHYRDLEALVHVGCPPPHVVSRVLDKNQTLEIARRSGIPVPATYLASGVADLERLRGKLHFPVIAKPRNKEDWGENAFKMRYYRNFRALEESFLADTEFGDQNLFQEYFLGEGVGIEVLIHEGEPVAIFQHRRLKELPIGGGGSVQAISEPLDPSLADLALTLLRELEWEGVAMVEFRYNRIDHKAALMEVNGRYWGSLPLAVQSGVDFPYYEWQIVHGIRPQVPLNYKIGVRVRWFTGDLRRLVSLFTEPTNDGFPRPSRPKELARFVTDFRFLARPVIWSLSDPVPVVSELASTVKAMLTSSAKAVARKLLSQSVVNLIAMYRDLGRRERAVYAKLRFQRALRLRRDRPPTSLSGVHSVLFVCHGNIIRSPMAAALLRKHLLEQDRGGVVVTSAGLYFPARGCHGDETNNSTHAVDPRACVAAWEFGISLDDHKARPLTQQLVEEADVIFVMDYLNEARILARHPASRHKVFMLATVGGEIQRHQIEISDPFQSSMSEIRRCYEILDSHVCHLARLMRLN
jgi:protein-tyrosine-phosphatase/predicted ATP-grasp superfamily ATP-dependent carboligase